MITLIQNNPKPTPMEVLNNLVENFETSDFLWMIIIAILTVVLYKVSTIKIRQETSDWLAVVRDLFFLGGAVVGFFTFGKFDVDTTGWKGYLLLLISFIISLLALILYANSIKNSTKIINSLIVGIIGFGMFYSVVIQELGFFYAVLFGFIGGLSTGRAVKSIKNLNPIEEEEDTDSKWNKSKKKNF